MQRQDVSSLTLDQLQKYLEVHSDFINNTAAVQDHSQWHMDHMPDNAPGNGQAFLLFHRRFIKRLEQYARLEKADDLVPLVYWDAATAIPAALEVGIANPNPKMPLPSWATVRGGTDTAPIFAYTKLAQFKTMDELGRAIVNPYHDSLHGTVGGLMARITTSPRAPIFFLWHAFLDNVFANWQELAGDRRIAPSRRRRPLAAEAPA